MRFVVAGGGVAGLPAALAVARAGHDAVILERDAAGLSADPMSAFREGAAWNPSLLSRPLRPPEGWRRPVVEQADCGILYYCRYSGSSALYARPAEPTR